MCSKDGNLVYLKSDNFTRFTSKIFLTGNFSKKAYLLLTPLVLMVGNIIFHLSVCEKQNITLPDPPTSPVTGKIENIILEDLVSISLESPLYPVVFIVQIGITINQTQSLALPPE